MAIIYVQSGFTGNGTTWNNAFGTLQDAIAAAFVGDQIWVAGGTYTPGTSRGSSFSLKEGVEIYGGFAGDENNLHDRNITANPTILSGDIGTVGDNSDNVYHVVRGSGVSNSAILDGFTITGGNAEDNNNASSNNNLGGGIFLNGADPTLSNLIVRENNGRSGGGLYNNNNSNPTLTNVTFEFNTATQNGGAIGNGNSNPTIINGVFRLNSSDGDGGAFYNIEFRGISNPTFVNTVFSRNSSNRRGGAVYNGGGDANANFINTSFSGNTAFEGSAIYSPSSNVSLSNSIIWDNKDSNNTGEQITGNIGSTITNNSIIQGGEFGGIYQDPLFVDADNDDLRLQSGSPALDTGDQSLLPADNQDIDGDGNTAETLPLDLSGNSRVISANVDLGAYEGVSLSPAPTPANVRTLFVDIDAVGNSDGSSWNNAFTSLQDALNAARSGDTIWVAEGTYKPTDGTSRSESFELKNHVEIYGGFNGTETSLNQRDIVNNVTILSGEIGDINTIDDNSYNVVTANRVTEVAVLDGFSIKDGNANGSSSRIGESQGGGIFVSEASATLNNLIIAENNADNGGGIFLGRGSSPTITNVTFEFNTARAGGAIYNSAEIDGNPNPGIPSNPTIINSIFRLNTALNGGAVYNDSNSNPSFINTVFSRNSAENTGGAVRNIGANPTFINSSFSGNTAVEASAINHSSGNLSLINSILWGNVDSSKTGLQINERTFNNNDIVNNGNVTVTNSIIQEAALAGIDGINQDPLFVDAANDDLRLQSGSPALDIGDQTLLPVDNSDIDGDGNTTETLSLDLSGNSRVISANVDLGAYEGVSLSPAPTPADVRLFYVDIDAVGNNDGTSWNNAFTSLQDALNATRSGDTIWVAEGTYKPTDGTDRNISFELKNHVEIYGGFNGTETSLNERDIVNNVTILSGEIGDTNTIDDNSNQVVVGSGTTETAILDGFTITGGNANFSQGGGIYNADGSPTLTNLIIDNNQGNTGGGIANFNGSSPTITNVTFSNNSASVFGGAVYNNGNSNPIFTDVTFINNSADSDGGAVSSSDNLVFLEATFINNSAENGGAIDQSGSGDLVITGGVFSGNVASSRGGAILTSISNFQLKDVTFNNNEAGRDAGAIWASSFDNATITDAIFTGNSAGNSFVGDGGAIYATGLNDNLSLTNVSFNLNNSNNDGGAIYHNGDNLQLTNGVFSRNTATDQGGAIYRVNASPQTNITNSSFSGNVADIGSAIATSSSSILIDLFNSIVWDNSGTPIVGTGVTADNSSIIQDGLLGGINQDPLFVDAANDDLRLQNNSPAINAGNNNNLPPDTQDLDKDGDVIDPIPFDLDGTTRVIGDNVDMGAYEFDTNNVKVAPVINDQTFSILEHSPVNTQIATVIATDTNNDPLTYSITAGNPDLDGDNIFGFAIDSNGNLEVADPDDLDFETNPNNPLTVEVSDGTLTDTATITINLTNNPDDDIEPPTTTNPATLELILYQDDNGVLGDVINPDEAILRDNFFVEVKLGDIRPDAAGLVAAAINFDFAPDVAQNIDDFADLSSILTPNFPLFTKGTLNNTTGNIIDLGAGALPPSFGSVLGVNTSDRFALLRFSTIDTRDDSQVLLTLDPTQTGYADGLFADPNGTLDLTRTLIINDAPEMQAIADTTLSETAASGTVIVADNLVTATDDEFGDPLTFALTTSPSDSNGNALFAIDENTGEITLTQVGADIIDFESGTTSYILGVTASDGFKNSIEETFSVNLLNENEATIRVFLPNGEEATGMDDITFTTELSRFRTDINGDPVADSEFIRPNYADTFKFIDILNDATGNDEILQITALNILNNLTGVSIDAPAGDILINPGERRSFKLTYAPNEAGDNFNENNGLTIISNAINDSSFEVHLAGKSTFNSDISYDGQVNLTDLGTLQTPGLFGSQNGNINYDPTADITGDGIINLAELVPLNAEFGSSVI